MTSLLGNRDVLYFCNASTHVCVYVCVLNEGAKARDTLDT